MIFIALIGSKLLRDIDCAQYISYEIKDFSADYFDIVVPPISESIIYMTNALELSEWSGAVIDGDEALAYYEATFPIAAGKIETAVLNY